MSPRLVQVESWVPPVRFCFSWEGKPTIIEANKIWWLQLLCTVVAAKQIHSLYKLMQFYKTLLKTCQCIFTREFRAGVYHVVSEWHIMSDISFLLPGRCGSDFGSVILRLLIISTSQVLYMTSFAYFMHMIVCICLKYIYLIWAVVKS